MKIVITGSRTIANQNQLKKRFDTMFRRHLKITGTTDTRINIIHGGARGADNLLAAVFTQEDKTPVKYEVDGRLFDVVVSEFPISKQDWEKYGGRAGPRRNALMLDQEPDVVFAFWRASLKSDGTINCVSQAAARGIPVLVEVLSELPPDLADRLSFK